MLVDYLFELLVCLVIVFSDLGVGFVYVLFVSAHGNLFLYWLGCGLFTGLVFGFYLALMFDLFVVLRFCFSLCCLRFEPVGWLFVLCARDSDLLFTFYLLLVLIWAVAHWLLCLFCVVCYVLSLSFVEVGC